jgi:hypothetical protein
VISGTNGIRPKASSQWLRLAAPIPMSIRRANYVTPSFGSKASKVTGQDVAELGTKRPN